MKNNTQNENKQQNNNRLKYGSYTAVMTVIIVVGLIIVNLLVSSLSIKFDLSQDKMYSIGDTTKELLTSLDKDVIIYTLYPTGEEQLQYMEIISQYEINSSHIKIINKDPYLYPQFVSQYAEIGESIPAGSLIVECGTRNKVIAASDLVSTEIDYNTYTQYVSAIEVEPRLTSAINAVISTETPKLYLLTGHSETGLSAKYKKIIEDENFTIETLNLMTAAEVPEDCAALLLVAPAKDISPEEVTKIEKYIDNNGRAFFVPALLNVEMPNLQALFNYYGVNLNNAIIIEGSAANAMQSNPMYLLPNFATNHAITESIVQKQYPIFLPYAQGFEILDMKRKTLTIDTILSTSNQAYGKLNLQAQTVEKEEGDLSGPFNLGLAITERYSVAKDVYEGRIVAVSSDAIIDDSVNEMVSGTNASFVVNSLNWLVDRSSTSIYVPSKAIKSTVLNMNGQNQLTLLVVSIVVIPAVVMGTGLIVWLRRRNK